MTALLSSKPEALPAGLADVAVELSLCAVYLAARLDDQSNPALTRALHQALERKGAAQDRVDLICQARGGMPEAIVPFHRPDLDVYFAAGLLAPDARLVLRGSGNSVEVGHFHFDRGSLKYVDTFERTTGFASEALNLFTVQGLLRKMGAWSDRPTVQVGDLVGDDFLRVQPGSDAFLRRPRKVAHKGGPNAVNQQATISLLRLFQHGVDAGDAHVESNGPLRAARVAWGHCRMQLSGADLSGSQTDHAAESIYRSIDISDIKPELMMELHAASMAAHDAGETLWLHLGFPGADFFSPAPDLLSPGASVEGWFAPYADIGRALGASPEVSVRVPRWAAIELMRRHCWLWSRDWPEWVRWAWYLDNT